MSPRTNIGLIRGREKLLHWPRGSAVYGLAADDGVVAV